MSSEVSETDEALWHKIAPIFSNRAFMRSNASWFSGLASRSGADRMTKLTRSRPAQRLKPLIAGLDRRRLGCLLVRSEINHDQAMSALRLTLVVNISVPVGALVLMNQFLPGSVETFLRDLPPLAVIAPLAMMLLLLIGVIWFAYAGVFAARDLNHLLRISHADAASTAPEEEGDDALSPLADWI
ncbi:MAG: hypothetical protein ACK4P2_06260 [Hyphomonas sp.]